jgi:hypothetical protein
MGTSSSQEAPIRATRQEILTDQMDRLRTLNATRVRLDAKEAKRIQQQKWDQTKANLGRQEMARVSKEGLDARQLKAVVSADTRRGSGSRR